MHSHSQLLPVPIIQNSTFIMQHSQCCFPTNLRERRRLNRLYSHLTMDEQEPVQVVELRISYRYAVAHPWVIQAIGGFLSAYFMEHPGFRVQRYMEELASGTHLWICEVPPSMKVPRLLKRLKEDIPPCNAQQIATDLPARPRYLIDCPE